MRVIYSYDCRTTAPWQAMKRAVAVSEGGADIRLLQLGSTASPVKGLYEGRLPVREFKYACRIKLWRSIRKRAAWLKLCRALLRTKADCYMASDASMLGILAAVARIRRARLVYVPSEYFAHASYGSTRRQRRWARSERRYCRRADAVVVVGEKMAEEYRAAYGLGDRVHSYYWGWPTSSSLPQPVLRKKLRLGPEHRILLYQGMIATKRGLLHVLPALKKLPKNVIFVILGYGPDVDLIRQTAEEMGLGSRVRLMDAVPQAELMAYTCDADIGIIPILNVCKSYNLCNPSKLFEFIAAGLPLAVSNLAQLGWWVSNRKLGVVFNPEDSDDVARALRRLLDDNEFRAKCAANSRRVHLTEACWEIQSARLRSAVLGS